MLRQSCSSLRGANENIPECRPNLRKKYASKLPKDERDDDDDEVEKEEEDERLKAETEGEGEDGGKVKASDNDNDNNGGAGTTAKDGDDDSSSSSGDEDVIEKDKYKEGTFMNYLFGRRITDNDKDRKKGAEDYLREDLLYSSRPPYCPLSHTVDNLIDEDEFFYNKKNSIHGSQRPPRASRTTPIDCSFMFWRAEKGYCMMKFMILSKGMKKHPMGN